MREVETIVEEVAVEIAEGAAETAAYTHNADYTPPTGLEMNTIPFIALIGCGILGFAWFVFKRKRFE